LLEAGCSVCGLTTRNGGKIRLGADDAVESCIDSVPAVDAIVHCAASKSLAPVDRDLVKTNCLGVLQVLEFGRRRQIRRYIYLSGTNVYGAPQYLPIDEKHPTAPETLYGASKLFGEHVMHSARAWGGRAVCFRVPSPVGGQLPRDRLLSRWISGLLSGKPPDVLGLGSKIQHYVDVRDIGRAVLLALEQSDSAGTFNIAGNEAISNWKLAECAASVVAPSLRPELLGRPDPDDRVRFEFSIEKATRELGFTPRFSISQSIQHTAAFYCEAAAHL